MTILSLRVVVRMSSAEAKRDAFGKLLHEYGNAKSIPENEWKLLLSQESFRVCRLNSMESCGQGTHINNYRPGTYTCTCCGAELFSSYDKFGSHGWMSFTKSIGKDKNILRVVDTRFDQKRTEATCKNCDAHLGHIYRDNVSETGERYCINSAALDFNPEKFNDALRRASLPF